MLHNNLDPEVADVPTSSWRGTAARGRPRSWDAFDAMRRRHAHPRCAPTRPCSSRAGSPSVCSAPTNGRRALLLANSRTWCRSGQLDEFQHLEAMGLTMYGQMTAGSWIYIGTQDPAGHLRCLLKDPTASSAAHRQRDPSPPGSAGGGAQPLAVLMAGGVALCIGSTPGVPGSVSSTAIST
ncbi:MAG: hypothetical protein R2713_20835 [Ilumatobacteraceae bacterium]